jgi:flagellar export protein FliJ
VRSFHFKLDRVRNYKTQVLDKEKKILGALQRKRTEIIIKINETENFKAKTAATAQEKQVKGISMVEMNSYSYLIENARQQIKVLYEQLKKAEEEIEIQRKVVVTIYQEKTGMDKLEEKLYEEYLLLEAKEQENEVMQVISNKLADKTQGGDDTAKLA